MVGEITESVAGNGKEGLSEMGGGSMGTSSRPDMGPICFGVANIVAPASVLLSVSRGSKSQVMVEESLSETKGACSGVLPAPEHLLGNMHNTYNDTFSCFELQS